MKKIAIGLAAALAVVGAEALEISKVQEGKLCALSFTYDDGVATHLSCAAGVRALPSEEVCRHLVFSTSGRDRTPGDPQKFRGRLDAVGRGSPPSK